MLNWGYPIGNGVILNKDGSRMAGYFYRGPDLSSAVPSQHEWISDRVSEALATFRGGWSFWIDASRLEAIGYPFAEAMHFPDPVSAMIDEERRQQFMKPGSHFETEYAVILQYTPPSRHKSRLADLVHSGSDGLEDGDAAELAFNEGLAHFENMISGSVEISRMLDFDVDGMRRSALVNYLEYTVSGERASLNLPPPGNTLDCLIGNYEFYPGDNPLVGDNYISAVRITGYPSGSWPGMLAALDRLPFPLRYSTRYIVLDQPEASKLVKGIQRVWSKSLRDHVMAALKMPDGVPDQDLANMTAEANYAVGKTDSALVGTGYYTSVVILMDRNLAVVQQRADDVARAINGAGFKAKPETTNAPEAWLGSLAAHSVPNIRRPPLHTDNLADLLPLTSVWQGEPECPCPLYPPNAPPLMLVDAQGATPFFLNLHVGDTGGTLLFGPPGSGKSTLLATVAMQALRYDGMTIWAFEKGRSMLVTAKAVGGDHYDFGVADAPKFCPLADLSTETAIAEKEEWISACFLLQHGELPDSQERSDIHDAMMLLAVPGAGRTISDFIRMAQAERVRDAMRFYSLAGTAGNLFDAEADTIDDGGHLKCFEIEDLMRRGEAILLPALLHMFSRFEKSLKGQPAMLLLDEAWIMFAHEFFRTKIREWFKVLRKANCTPVLATQSLSDAARSGLLDVLMEPRRRRFTARMPRRCRALDRRSSLAPASITKCSASTRPRSRSSATSCRSANTTSRRPPVGA